MREKTDKTEIQQEGMLNKYALVLTSIKGIGVKTFSYLIPEELKPAIKIGQPVLVPFGRMGFINAFVVGFSNYLPEGIKAKNISVKRECFWRRLRQGLMKHMLPHAGLMSVPASIFIPKP